jgi:helix-turn-helix protein
MRPRCALPYIIRTNGDKMNNQTTKTISVPEAGRVYFGLARNAAYEAAHRGDIPVIRIGRMMRVPIAALERMLEEARPTPRDSSRA